MTITRQHFKSLNQADLSILFTSLFLLLIQANIPVTAQTTDASKGLFEDPVVARNENFKIRKSVLDQEFIIFRNDVEKDGKTRLNSNLRHLYEKNLLKRLAFAEIMISLATAEEKEKAGLEAREYVRQNKNDREGQASFTANIIALGMTEQEYTNKLRDRKIAEKVLFRLLGPELEVSDAEVKAYYDGNPGLFTVPNFYKVSHIMISTRKPGTNEDLPLGIMMEKKSQAEEIASKAKDGESFEELVSRFSEDPRSKARGGVYEFAPGQLDPDFEKVAMNMSPGEISDPVKSRFGYHVIKFLEMRPSRKEPLEGKLFEDIKERLRMEKLQEKLQPFQDRMIQEHEVEFLLEK